MAVKASHIITILEVVASTRVVALAAGYLMPGTISVSGADETGITLSGHYEYSAYQGNPKPQYSATCNFQALVAGRAWIISYENTWATTNSSRLEGWADASCDGTNIYVVHPQPSVKKNALPMTTGGVMARANIYPGEYPPPEEWTVRNIWLAFASSSVLGAPKGRAKPPFFADLAKFYNTNYNCDYYWANNETQPNCRQLIFKGNGWNSVGVWRQVTNIANVIVPTKFEFTAFGLRSKTELMTNCTYCCTVTNAGRAAFPAVPSPLPNGNVLVTDFRFDKSGRTNYLATGNWIPQIIDPTMFPPSAGIKLNVGDPAPDFTFTTFGGKLLRLSSLRGKYVLLDFWATSCGPCIAEIPDLKAAYKAFGDDKRFAAVSLTSDAFEAETRNFVGANDMRWTQGFLDDHSKSAVEQTYGFTGIPQVLLVGPNGKLVAKDLGGTTMRQAVALALGSR